MRSDLQEPAIFTIELLERKLSDQPGSPLFARLASLYLVAERFEKARETCERGITRYPDYATGHLILGECYFRLHRFSDARRELSAALVLQPRCRKARELLLRIDAAESARAEQEGMQHVKEIAHPSLASPGSIEEQDWVSDPSTEIATPTLAEIYANQGAFREAIRTYSVFLRRNPEAKNRFEQRIRELEEKWKALEPPG